MLLESQQHIFDRQQAVCVAKSAASLAVRMAAFSSRQQQEQVEHQRAMEAAAAAEVNREIGQRSKQLVVRFEKGKGKLLKRVEARAQVSLQKEKAAALEQQRVLMEQMEVQRVTEVAEQMEVQLAHEVASATVHKVLALAEVHVEKKEALATAAAAAAASIGLAQQRGGELTAMEARFAQAEEMHVQQVAQLEAALQSAAQAKQEAAQLWADSKAESLTRAAMQGEEQFQRQQEYLLVEAQQRLELELELTSVKVLSAEDLSRSEAQREELMDELERLADTAEEEKRVALEHARQEKEVCGVKDAFVWKRLFRVSCIGAVSFVVVMLSFVPPNILWIFFCALFAQEAVKREYSARAWAEAERSLAVEVRRTRWDGERLCPALAQQLPPSLYEVCAHPCLPLHAGAGQGKGYIVG
jgi:hypothetical protein